MRYVYSYNCSKSNIPIINRYPNPPPLGKIKTLALLHGEYGFRKIPHKMPSTYGYEILAYFGHLLVELGSKYTRHDRSSRSLNSARHAVFDLFYVEFLMTLR